jgi:hypothetical protein
MRKLRFARVFRLFSVLLVDGMLAISLPCTANDTGTVPVPTSIKMMSWKSIIIYITHDSYVATVPGSVPVPVASTSDQFAILYIKIQKM